ncbi:LysR family transcriptional regulator [Neptuniibacter pectenicola]|jgi:DNA-binding transcriptional LysR family regulator|uniref:LysR family transcriptional regulator n=1 Tax=Neptuniibacter pectenicola TaxID=1806669 RepID=A0ABU9TMZ6_9GAMM|nr:LysR family transcriptional regulator [Neptuniibacter pectenicola]
MPAVTLDQWQTLIAVVDKGGYAAAAEVLNKSQSTVSYAIQKLESSLNIRAFSIDGRRAILTPAGKTLYQRAKVLLEEANQLETQAQQFSEGWEPELRIAMDTLFPEWVMLDVIDQFIQAHPLTRIELMETVLSGTDEALLKKEADIVIGGRIPPGFLGDPILLVNFCAVASPNHPLHQLNRPLNYQDLRLHRQLVVKDSGSRDLDAGWLGAQHRLTLGHLRISIDAACKGLGYAWFPTLKIQHELDQGQLKPLNLDVGGKRDVQLNLIYSAGDYAGPAAKLFGSLLTTHTANIAT